tara:strand:+ start:468 stop:836 length:369 start_codon:yes stop_codon:yes gene_type:complete
MIDSIQHRLDSIVSGRLPAGSSDSRTLGIVLLVEVLEELRSIRELLESEVHPPTEEEPVLTRAEEQPQPDLLNGTVKVLQERVAGCSDVSVLGYALQAENSKKRPRKTLTASIESRIRELTN